MAPAVSVDTDFSFYINSIIPGATGAVEKLIKLKILKCNASNCQKWLNNSTYWDTCNSGYTLNSGVWNLANAGTTNSNTSNTVENKTDTAIVLSIVIQSIFAASLVTVLLSSITSTSLMASLWSIVNQMQILFLLLITGAYIPSDIKTVITGAKFAIFPIKYIPFDKISVYNNIIGDFDFELSFSDLEAFQIDSDSSVFNILSFVISFLPIIILHLWWYVAVRWITNREARGRRKCWKSIIKYLVNKLYFILTFGYYIRVMLESNQYLLVSTVNEFSLLNTSNKMRISSLFIAILILISLLFTIIFVMHLALTVEKRTKYQHDKFGEFFTGIKTQKTARLYIWALMLRRAVFIVLLITLVSKSSVFVIGVLWVIQLFYLNYMIHLRPLESTKSNLIEIVNELYFVWMLGWLLHFDSKELWTQSSVSVCMWVVASNSMTTFIIVFVDFVATSIKAWRKSWSQASPKAESNVPNNNVSTANQIVPKQVSLVCDLFHIFR